MEVPVLFFSFVVSPTHVLFSCTQASLKFCVLLCCQEINFLPRSPGLILLTLWVGLLVIASVLLCFAFLGSPKYFFLESMFCSVLLEPSSNFSSHSRPAFASVIFCSMSSPASNFSFVRTSRSQVSGPFCCERRKKTSDAYQTECLLLGHELGFSGPSCN